MKISLYSPLDPTLIGGMRTWLHDFWIPYVEKRPVELRVIHTATRPAQAPDAYRALPQAASLQIIRIPGMRIPGSGAYLPRAADLALAMGGSDVLYVDNGYVFQDLAALAAARISGARTISGHHSVIVHRDTGLDSFVHNAAWNAIGKRAIKRFDAVHALNSTDAAYLRRVGGRNVCVVPLPVDLSLFAPGEKAPVFTVLFVGRFHPQKGIDRLERIVTALLAQQERIAVRIIGAGPQREIVETLGRDSRVSLRSGLERAQVASEMRAAHVLIAPSRSETFGFVAAESLASGTPVIASPTNGFLDLVNSGNGAIVRQPDETGVWLQAVSRIRALTFEEYTQLCSRASDSVRRLAFDQVAAGMDALLAKLNL